MHLRKTNRIDQKLPKLRKGEKNTFLRQRRPCSSPSASPTHRKMKAGVSAIAYIPQAVSRHKSLSIFSVSLLLH
jgi:hypothetical protein